MELKLKTSDIRNFISLSSFIVSNSIIPIYDYILLFNRRLVKTNGVTYISHEIDVIAPEEILIEERVISAFAKLTKNEFINVSTKPKEKGVEITFSDGEMEQTFQSPPSVDFSKLPEYSDAEKFELDYEKLESIGIAAKSVSDLGMGENFAFVHLNNNYVFGSNRQKMYAKKFDKLPDAIFDSQTASVISQFDHITFFQKGTYNFFDTGTTLYGFQQYGDVKHYDIIKFLQKELNGDFFEFEVDDVLRFCDLVSMSVKLGPKDVAECLMEGKELSCTQSFYNKTAKRTLNASGTFQPRLRFNPKFIAPYLKSLGKETIRFHDFGNTGVYISDISDRNFIGMVANLSD